MSTSAFQLGKFVNAGVLDSMSDLASTFSHAQPFRHVVIDDFLTQDFCRAICEQFPEFRDADAINENQEVGGKATREKVRTLGSAYRDMDDLVQNRDFLELVGEITGIEDLNYDPHYFGGGTHENREGQDLDPHIDFNYHPVTNQHRRLNLIIYLNEGWQDDWGGSLQLHRDPYREPVHDEIITVSPLMNRCVIFETTESSWHGFEQIRLPAEEKARSRKSFAVYYYTKKRPEAETSDEHSTVYVERHLPDHFQPGMQLEAEDLLEMKRLLSRRDQHLQRLYRDIRNLQGTLSASRNSGRHVACSTPKTGDFSGDMELAARTISGLRHRIDELEASTSWRMTAPIRALKRLLTGHT